MRYFIIAAIICAVTLCTALVSVSLSAWISGTASVTAEGKVGQFYVNYPRYADGSTTKLRPAEDVRKVNASTTGSGTTFTYHNYICVSRVGATDEESYEDSIAFLEFKVEALGSTVLEDVEVESITITRHGTHQNDDTNGTYKAGDLDGTTRMAPRIYGVDSVKTLNDINYSTETIQSIKDKYNLDTLYDGTNMVDHVTGGIFCILYFSENDKYYAMDITITTKKAAQFKLTAKANNVNQWQRYTTGNGQPFGFYLGGHINGVDNWDPRYTTHMQGTTITSYDSLILSEETYFDEIYKTYVDPKFNEYYYYDYKTYGYSASSASNTTNLSQKFKYPKYIDVALNLSLTAGSHIKMYMVDSVGNRLASINNGKVADNKTIYFVPKNITYSGFSGNQAPSFVTNNGTTDFDISIPEDGEYTIHFYGKVSYKFDDSKAINTKETNNYMTESATETVVNADGSTTLKYTLETNKGSDSNYSFINNGNCSIENLRITRKEQNIANPKHTVSFVNPEVEGGMITAQYVKDNGSPVEPSGNAIVADGYSIEGYYKSYDPYKLDFVEKIEDLTKLIIGQDTVIYVKWIKNGFTIEFNANGGSCSTTLMQTGADGKLNELPIPEYTNYAFIGWFTDATAGTKITLDTTFTSDALLYARWSNVWVTINSDATRYALTDAGNDYSGKQQYKIEGLSLSVDDTLYLHKSSTSNMNLYVEPGSKGLVAVNNSTTNGGNTHGVLLSALKVATAGEYTIYAKVNGSNFDIRASNTNCNNSDITYAYARSTNDNTAYLIGNFHEDNNAYEWAYGYSMGTGDTNHNMFTLSSIYLYAGDEFKIRYHDSDTNGAFTHIAEGTSLVEDSNTNIKIKESGNYRIVYYREYSNKPRIEIYKVQ